MALINCPECGKQISDKAKVCPQCGIDVQKILAEIREKERQQQKKRRRRTIISITSVCFVAAFTVLAYLYYIDALNSIPSEYRKQTQNYFESCESTIEKDDFDRANGYLSTLKKRTLTNRQTKRFKAMEKALAEIGLNDLENTLASIANNSDTQIDNKVMKHAKEEMSALDSHHLNAAHTERLKKAKEKYVELILAAIEKKVGLLERNTQGMYSYEGTQRLAKDLQELELTTTQKTRLEKALQKAERIKQQQEENKQKQLLNMIGDEYIKLLSDNKSDDSDFDSSDEGYFLYDINNNGIPELWIKTGTCEADYKILVFTYGNGIRKIYDESAGHTSFYQGDGYVLQVYEHMGHAMWHKLIYTGYSITAIKKLEEFVENDYKDPEEKYITLYPLTNKQPILNAFKIE